MQYKSKKIAKMMLERLEKHGDNVYDGLTPSAPSNVIDNNRALEEMELVNAMDQKFKDKIELSKRLMDIDPEYFSVNRDVSNKLIDYIEQSGEELLMELKNELQTKQDEYKLMIKEVKELEEDDFLSIIDYKRAVAHRIRMASEFKDKLEYLKLTIKTIENFEREYDDVPESKQWDFSFTNENANFYGASKLK
jgi:hypothetical protein